MTTGAEWSGPVGDAWAQEWRRTDRSFAGLAPHLDRAILASAPLAPFTAFDVGCGAGATSLALATARPDARVIGADLSPGLVAAARGRAGDAASLDFVVGDAPALALSHAPLDLIFSRHGVMFFADPVASFSALRRAANGGGKLVFSCFAAIADNPWASILPTAPRPAGYTPGPFAFADPDFVRDMLARSGWGEAVVERASFAYGVGAGADAIDDGIAFFSRIGPVASALREAAPADRPRLEATLATAIAAHHHYGGSAGAASQDAGVVDFPAAAWIWSASATGEPR